MLSLDKDQALDRIGEGLRRVGAGVLVAIDIRSLCDVERSYGGEAHQQTLDNLVKLVREIAHEIADGTEVYATAERGGDTILALRGALNCGDNGTCGAPGQDSAVLPTATILTFVPEPSVAVLLGLSLAGLALARRREV